MMIQALVRHGFQDIEICHVRMGFSSRLEEVGTFHPGKLLEILRVLTGILSARFLHGARVLYYPPAGGNLVPILRDLLLLIPTRWLFRKTVFHFHADGLNGFLETAPAWIRLPARLAYGGADLAILTSKGSHIDTRWLGCASTIVVPNGVQGPEDCPPWRPPGKVHRLLFIGALIEAKGAEILLQALGVLLKQGHPVHLDLVGGFRAKDYSAYIHRHLEETGLAQFVTIHGILTDTDKDNILQSCDLFVFPSHYEAETFGLVLAEAMAFGKPVIATHWSGLPETVGTDEQCGLLVPPKDPEALAHAIRTLIQDPDRARQMGEAGRRRYEERFSLPTHLTQMERALSSVTE